MVYCSLKVFFSISRIYFVRYETYAISVTVLARKVWGSRPQGERDSAGL